MASFRRIAEPVGPVFNGPGAKHEYPVFVLPKVTPQQREAIDRAKKYAMEQSIKCVLVRQTAQHQIQQMANVKRAQAIALLSRIYVGSIAYEVSEETVRQGFLPFGPIKSISMSLDPITQKHKGFAFIEYELPEAALLALDQMNGGLVGGRVIKVGRPSNMPNTQPMIEELISESRQYNRIYVSSVHPDLTDQDLQTVFEAFGKVISCKLETEPSRSNRHRGYGFIEYETAQSASDAIASMNLFDLGGQLLRVGRAVTPPNTTIPSGTSCMPTAAAVAAASITAKVIAMEAEQVHKVQSDSGSQDDGGGATAGSSSGTRRGFSSGFGSGGSHLPPPGVVIPQSISLPAASSSKFSNAPAAMAGALGVSSSLGSWDEDVDSEPGEQRPQPQQPAIDPQPPQDQEDRGMMTLESQENLQIRGREARHLVMQKLLTRAQQSRVLVLRNMVGTDDCDSDLEAEVSDECSKFGPVDRVLVYQERETEAEDANVLVKIFVVFEGTEAAPLAAQSLDGRFFGGRTVSAQVYDQQLFDANDLTM